MSPARTSPPDGSEPARSPPPRSLAIHRDGAAVVVAICGELDADTVPGLDHILRDLICDQGNLRVAVDVGAVSNADATGVAALVDAYRLAREHHATLTLLNLAPAVEQALERWDHQVVVTDLPASATGAREHRPASPDDHVVDFYFRDEHLAASVRDFLLPALHGGQGALVVATDDHRRRCDDELRAAGVDVDDCRRQGRYVSLDARETLAELMVGDVPDDAQFETVVGGLVRRLATGFGGVRIFGEMVAVLWADGRVGAAIALEDLWNSLGAKETFELLCAYPLSLFDRDDATEPFRHICDRHTRVVSSERIAVERRGAGRPS